MQTFLPYADFEKSASVLDYRRLGKQRLECDQILRALISNSVGWRRHPAVMMWAGHEKTLCEYAEKIIDEWRSRGYKNTMEYPGSPCWCDLHDVSYIQECDPPPWLGDEEFHASHRAALLHKNPEWYGQFGWTEIPELRYKWPVS